MDATITYLTGAPAQIYGLAVASYTNAADAYASATAAAGSASTTAGYVSTAMAHRDSAAGYATASMGYRDTALVYRDAALGHRNAAEGFKNDAAASATAAANNALSLVATSSTSVTLGTGVRTFAVQAGKQFAPGADIKVVDSGNTARAMYGTITSYSGTSLVVNVTTAEGTGSGAAWNISVSGQRGVQGIQGLTGPTVAIASAAEVRTGTDNAKAISAAALKAAIGFTSYVQTADQTPVSQSTLTIAHGLGRRPVLLQGFVRQGGIEITLAPGTELDTSTSTTYGYSMRADATNIYISFGGPFGGDALMIGPGDGPISNQNPFFVRAYA